MSGKFLKSAEALVRIALVSFCDSSTSEVIALLTDITIDYDGLHKRNILYRMIIQQLYV